MPLLPITQKRRWLCLIPKNARHYLRFKINCPVKETSTCEIGNSLGEKLKLI